MADTTTEPLPGLGEECDAYEPPPLCTQGLKCLPQSSDGIPLWDHFSCQRLVADPVALYESCQWASGQPYLGTDNCGESAFCRPIWPDGGECIGMCEFGEAYDHDTASCEDPEAQAGDVCASCFCTCEPTCDPLDSSSCGADEMCARAGCCLFTCAPDASEEGLGNAGDPCHDVNECHHGLVCLHGSALPGCESSLECCTEYCDTTDPDFECPGARDGVECVSWWTDPESALPGLERLGLCMLPAE